MENEIQILVMGSIASGKSTIAQEIVSALRNQGFDVKWEVKPDYETEEQATKEGTERLNRLEAITNKAIIVVKEVQVQKDFNASLNYRVKEYTKKK